jgi:polyisoprenoid-binding protein YceI
MEKAVKKFAMACILVAAAATATLVTAGPRPAAAEATGKFNVDNVHSSVVFCVRHMNVANFYGRFNTIEGEIVLDGDNSKFEFSIPVDSIDTNNGGRDKHLKSPEYFNVDEHKTLSFKSSKVKASGDQYEVTGEMTMLGKPVEMTVTITKTGETKGRHGKTVIGLESNFVVKRSAHGMTAGLPQLGDDVRMTVSLEAVSAE